MQYWLFLLCLDAIERLEDMQNINSPMAYAIADHKIASTLSQFHILN